MKGNFIHVIEGGTTLIKPDWKELVTGKIMYDGLSMIISSTEKLIDPKIERDSKGRQEYSFNLNINSNKATPLA